MNFYESCDPEPFCQLLQALIKNYVTFGLPVRVKDDNIKVDGHV